MAKILLAMAGLLILIFIVVAMYCALIVAGRADECAKNERENHLFWKK